MIWADIFSNYLVFLMVFLRMAGMILFNPIFGRRQVPAMLRMGLAFFLASLLSANLSGAETGITTYLDFVLAGMKELLVGFVAGYILQMFLAVVLVAGEIIDLQMGFGMAKFYDPQSNVSMPITGSFFNVIFTLVFFLTNAHLTFIRLVAETFAIIPPGFGPLNPRIGPFLVQLLALVFVLATKLALPLVAIELISELGVGVLMRVVPEINIFNVGLQLKAMIGLVVLILMAPLLVSFLDGMMTTMLNHLDQGLKTLS